MSEHTFINLHSNCWVVTTTSSAGMSPLFFLSIALLFIYHLVTNQICTAFILAWLYKSWFGLFKPKMYEWGWCMRYIVWNVVVITQWGYSLTSLFKSRSYNCLFNFLGDFDQVSDSFRLLMDLPAQPPTDICQYSQIITVACLVCNSIKITI